MRIVGGIWRGRAIEAPEGRDTRPTTDRMRESIASMLLSAFDLDLSGVSVLDAFAGSGAMGLELLSRGAEHATFVDVNRKALSIVRRNVGALGAQSQTSVVCGDAFMLAGRSLPGTPFDLLILDPPYTTDVAAVSALVDALASAGALGRGAIVLYERSASAPSLDAACATMLREKTHGITSIDLYRVREEFA